MAISGKDRQREYRKRHTYIPVLSDILSQFRCSASSKFPSKVPSQNLVASALTNRQQYLDIVQERKALEAERKKAKALGRMAPSARSELEAIEQAFARARKTWQEQREEDQKEIRRLEREVEYLQKKLERGSK
jgi:hypothetical protein